ncbi:hypothetical protein H257_18329 [Aphanomyces astaci]|uniref:Reverse transcriptase/retrotransposon-derived protein RNase H-like domain-containing protein n=1 Tax=Aphanomyces astaci TaxID=112090 RepID=W4FDN7_APHAT|nr:hypothetical protein H257_18329 [Aphanomyces astaci]ETV64848.1 hypothetical protein H257_18329 [Aphanomyces astaci]|eukprot:XP_009845667.1 hypothetical protein H257_18329 [Aphanomyces astaci]
MSKCQWGRDRVGHTITPGGILPNPEKVKAVLRIKPLRNVAQVRSFLGLAGYFRRFIKGYATISRPLEQLKLTSPLILAYPDFDLPFTILVDACPIALGAVLMQEQRGRHRVIAYTSQALDATQQKWISKKDEVSEIECYGLTGSKSGNGQLARWAVHLQSLDFTVIHRPGAFMGCADGLSRLPLETQEDMKGGPGAVALRWEPEAEEFQTLPATAAENPAPYPPGKEPPKEGRPEERETSPGPSGPHPARDPFGTAMKAYLEENALPLDPWLMRLVSRTSEHYSVKEGVLYRRVVLKSPTTKPAHEPGSVWGGRQHVPDLPAVPPESESEPINVDRLKAFHGYWTQPFNDEVPERYTGPAESGTASDDTVLEDDLLPRSSFVERVDFPEGYVAYANSHSPVLRILDKRHDDAREVEYLVQHADDTTHWTRRSRLVDYNSFITEYENESRTQQGLPGALAKWESLVEPSERKVADRESQSQESGPGEASDRVPTKTDWGMRMRAHDERIHPADISCVPSRDGLLDHPSDGRRDDLASTDPPNTRQVPGRKTIQEFSAQCPAMQTGERMVSNDLRKARLAITQDLESGRNSYRLTAVQGD